MSKAENGALNDIRLLLQTHMQDSEKRAKRIEVALVGDKDMGIPGMISTVQDHGKRLKAYDTIRNKIIGGAIIISAASGLTGHLVPKLVQYLMK